MVKQTICSKIMMYDDFTDVFLLKIKKLIILTAIVEINDRGSKGL